MATLSLFAALGAGCSSSPTANEGTADGSATTGSAANEGPNDAGGSAKSVCAAYIARTAEVSPESVGPLVHLYGDASPCWSGSAADAEACGKACASAVASMQHRPEPKGPDPLGCRNVLAPRDITRPLALAVRYKDVRGQVPEGVSTLLCDGTDPSCRAPLAVSADNATGAVTATIYYGFDGFFDLRSPAPFVPTYRVASQPLQSSVTYEQPLWRAAELDAWADAALGGRNVYDSATHGIVFLSVRDCNQTLLSGIAVTTTAVDPLVRFVVLAPNGQGTPGAVTGEAGALAIVNVPPGLHTFTAEFAGTKKRLGSTRILVRAGAVTALDLLPSL